MIKALGRWQKKFSSLSSIILTVAEEGSSALQTGCVHSHGLQIHTTAAARSIVG